MEGGKANWFWTIIYKEGETYEWEFVNGAFEWRWVFNWNHWLRYEWEYKGDKKEWQWVCVYEDWSIYSWEWENNNLKVWTCKIKYNDWEVEYDVERDNKWLRITTEWDDKGKYLEDWFVVDKTS